MGRSRKSARQGPGTGSSGAAAAANNPDGSRSGSATAPASDGWDAWLWPDLLLFGFTSTLALSMQWLFIPTDVPGGDSGELIAEACHRGVPHPPGYPLFVLSTNLFQKIVRLSGCDVERCSPAWAANCLSTICGSCASGFVALTVLTLSRAGAESSPASWCAASVAGLTFSLSPLVWTYTTGAEVFALNNLLCSALLFLAVRLEAGKGKGLVSNRFAVNCLGAFLCGLALSNQHTSVLFIVPLVSYVLGVLERPFLLPNVGVYAYCFMCGLVPYLQTFVAGPHPGSWGHTSSLRGLATHILRTEYGTLSLSPQQGPSESFWERNRAYLEDLVQHQLQSPLHIVAVITAIGVVQLCARPRVRELGCVLVATLVVYFGVFHVLANLPLSLPMPREVHRRFWIQPHLVICVWFGAGLDFLAAVLRRRLGSEAVSMVLVTLILAPMVSQTLVSAPRRPTHLVGAFSDAILDNLPPNSLLLSHTDINWNGVRYKQVCEGKRPDVVHLSFQMMPYPWFATQQHPLYEPNVSFVQIPPGQSLDRGAKSNGELVVSMVKANLDKFPGGVFVDLHSLNDADLGPENLFADSGVHFLPFGLVWRAVLSMPQDGEEWLAWQNSTRQVQTNVQGKLVLPRAQLALLEPGSWEWAARSITVDSIYQRGIFLLTRALRREKDPEYPVLLQEAVALLMDCVNVVESETPTLSFAERDVAKNAALASIKWVQIGAEVNHTATMVRATKIARRATNFFLSVGDKRDPAYEKFKVFLNAIDDVQGQEKQ